MLLNLLVLRAEDPGALVRFYEALGLSFHVETHDGGPEHHACVSGGMTLEIYPARQGESSAATRIGFMVGDVVHAYGVAESLGAGLEAPARMPWGLRAVIVDPAGHKVELVQKS
jgi:lactoylglutathione lyase